MRGSSYPVADKSRPVPPIFLTLPSLATIAAYDQSMTVRVPTPLAVAAAAIVDSLSSPTQLLCAARAYPPDLQGRFELPGGKVEPRETWEEALHREIREELSVEIRLGPELEPPASLEHWPILQGHVMRVWLAQILPPTAKPVAGPSHNEVRWLPFSQIKRLPWLASNLPIIDQLVEQFAPQGGALPPACGTVEGTSSR